MTREKRTELILLCTFAFPQTVIALLYVKCVPILCSNIKITTSNTDTHSESRFLLLRYYGFRLVLIEAIQFEPPHWHQMQKTQTHTRKRHIKMVSHSGRGECGARRDFISFHTFELGMNVRFVENAGRKIESKLPLFACVIIPFWECFICTWFRCYDGILKAIFE